MLFSFTSVTMICLTCLEKDFGYIRDNLFEALILFEFMLHNGKILKCSQICSLYGIIIGISHSLVYHSLSIGGLTNSLCCNNIYA
jgi:hypothetical protein